MSNHDSAPPDRLRLLAQLLTTTPDPHACTLCRDQLETYINKQLAGEDYMAQLPEVAQHLDQCVDCAEIYEQRYDEWHEACERCLDYLADNVETPLSPLDTQALPDEVAQHLARCAACTNDYDLLHRAVFKDVDPGTGLAAPSPDLHFLNHQVPDPAAPTPDRPFRPQPVGDLPALLAQAIQQLDTGVRVQLSAGLLEWLRPPAGAALRGVGGPLFELKLDAPSPAIEQLTIAAHTSGQADRCVLRVELTLADRDWLAQEGVALELHTAGEIRRTQTDAMGHAEFPDVPQETLPQATLLITV
ncbi:MAG TPA: hypothetical protein VFS21_34205 [Roseiflexaceae bacterium]|nr:hypothetical protein [Roseiflexaceae bacterium]